MSKTVLIIGAFDCFNRKDYHLIKEAKKQCLGGKLVVLVYDDYPHYELFGNFPKQNLQQRVKNLEYFIKSSNMLLGDGNFKSLRKIFPDDDLLFVHYGDDKEFSGREDLKELGITIKFIKPYVKA